jgi:ribosomal protein S18 acetylase RimI-like enzyme
MVLKQIKMIKYNIRACTPNDLDRLMILIEKHAAFEKAAYSPVGKKEKLQAALFTETGPLHCIVAELANEVIGYATYTFDYSTWDAAWFIYLDCLYLDDEYRSFGIGAELMKKVKEAGVDRHCVNMQWQTPHFNERAIKFYERIGGIGKDKVRFTLPIHCS